MLHGVFDNANDLIMSTSFALTWKVFMKN